MPSQMKHRERNSLRSKRRLFRDYFRGVWRKTPNEESHADYTREEGRKGRGPKTAAPHRLVRLHSDLERLLLQSLQGDRHRHGESWRGGAAAKTGGSSQRTQRRPPTTCNFTTPPFYAHFAPLPLPAWPFPRDERQERNFHHRDREHIAWLPVCLGI